MNWKTWLKGLAAAAVSGGAAGATQVIGTSGTVTKATGAVAGVSALMGALLYILKSPLQQPAEPAPNPVSAAPTEPERK